MFSPLGQERFWFGAKFLALLSVIVFSSQVIQRELIEYYTLKDTPSPDSISVRPLRRTPWYQVLPKDAVIYSSREEVLKKRDEFVGRNEDFLFIDLDEMAMERYEKGEAAGRYEVRAKGEEGSFSETPNGLYRLEWKEENHFSKIHRVWMPWSMHFFGNYFIHGWPYLPNGAPVRSTTSGGCIRLSTADANILYQTLKIGTPILVATGRETRSAEFTYFKRLPIKHETPQTLALSARAALAADLDTGEILWQKESNRSFPIGSLTQLMTALVASEAIDSDKKIGVTKKVRSLEEDITGFAVGEKFIAGDLLYPLLLSSSDVAAEVLKGAVWNFLDIMNQKARSIGLAATHFEDAAGRSGENRSTAADIFRLIRFIYAHKRPLFELTAVKDFSLRSQIRRYGVENENWSLADSRFAGGKAGALPDGSEFLAGAFRVPFSEYGDRTIGIVLLGSANRIADVNEAVNYLGDQYVYGSVLGTRLKVLPVTARSGASLFEALRAPEE